MQKKSKCDKDNVYDLIIELAIFLYIYFQIANEDCIMK